MKKMLLQKLTLMAITLFLTVSCSKDDVSAPAANLPKVTIGNQIWQSSNLDVITYRDGTPIPQVTDEAEWANLTTGAWCYYENNTDNGTTYGKLYNWYAVMGIHDNDASTPNKVLAPTGWHVPTDAEWTTLTIFLGGEEVAGGKMKATGTSLWIAPNYGATNSSGFTGLPGGVRYSTGQFGSGTGFGEWWSSSEVTSETSWIQGLIYNSSFIFRREWEKKTGMSVRCLRN